jgi:hypothetical protein
MSELTTKQGNGSVVLNIIIGIVVVSGVVWLLMTCPSCH